MGKKNSKRTAKVPKQERAARSERIDFDEKQIKLAGELAGLGLNLDQIAHLLKVSPATLDRRIADTPDLAEAMDRGRADAASQVTRTAFQMATSGESPKMTIFWLQCRLGWAAPKVIPEEPDFTFKMSYAKAGT